LCISIEAAPDGGALSVDFNWQDAKLVIDILGGIAVLLGVPAGLYQFARAVKKEQRDREYATYDAVDQRFVEFETFCFEHTRLDISGIQNAQPYELTAEEQKQELIAFSVLLSMFERAFLMYHDQSTEIKRRQWSGWDEYIRGYCKRENFRKAWPILGTTFDSEFQAYMRHFIL
jgi:hypothetical protein